MSQEKYNDIIKLLGGLGFTDLEAAVYAYLVENSPATAYRAAKEIGKPVANTYKAVQALYQKGAVLIDETENRLCQAVAPAEVLGKLKNSFLDRHQEAEEALARLKPSGDSEKIFSLSTSEQVFERCRSLFGEAHSIILVDAFPGIVEKLKPWLEEAAGRGIKVVLQVYRPTEINGVETVALQTAELMLKRWTGEWLIAVVDGMEYLFAFLSDDGRSVHKAIWCGSAFLALPQHSYLAHSMRACVMEDLIQKGVPIKEILDELSRTEEWLLMGSRGYEKLTADLKEKKV
ncbi:MAG: helix-turn-helix domain-containing protein [Pyrinomonadaceae bacterium]